MITTKAKSRNARRSSPDAGFSLLEALFAIVILVVGLVGLLSLFTQSLVMVKVSQYDMIAKAKAEEALESVVSAKTTADINWANVQNVSNGGIFVDGFEPLLGSGPDGLIGTADDVGQEYSAPTGDSDAFPLTNFQRQIKIDYIPLSSTDSTPNPDIRQITVTVQYTLGNISRQQAVTSNISRFR